MPFMPRFGYMPATKYIAAALLCVMALAAAVGAALGALVWLALWVMTLAIAGGA